MSVLGRTHQQVSYYFTSAEIRAVLMEWIPSYGGKDFDVKYVGYDHWTDEMVFLFQREVRSSNLQLSRLETQKLKKEVKKIMEDTFDVKQEKIVTVVSRSKHYWVSNPQQRKIK